MEGDSHDEGPENPDRALMRRLAQGDSEALGPLMERHHVRLYRIALSYLRNPDDARDVVQEAFVRVFEHARRWRGDAEVGPWLTRIAVNQSIDHYRKSKRRRGREEPLESGSFPSTLPLPDGRVFSSEIARRVDRALEALPERQRAVFVLRHYEEMTLPEIASSLGMNLGTVKSNLHRALARLRQRLVAIAP